MANLSDNSHPRKLIISIDIGTSALKVGLFDVDGNLLKLESNDQKLIYPKSNRVEQSPLETWQLIKKSINSFNKDHYSKDVVAISIAVQRGSVIPLDKLGRPLSNQVVWMDKRGVPYVDKVFNIIGKERYYMTAGHSLSYISGASKVIWYQYEGNEIWENCSVIGTPQTYFLRRLGCEDLVCDYSSGTYHFPFNIDIKEWSKEIAHDLNFPIEKLPKLVKATDIVGYLSKNVAEELGLNEGIPIIAGGGDGQCASAGCGAITPGIGMVNIGTATGVQFFLEKPYRNPGMIFSCSGHVVADGWESEGHTQASGSVFRWFKEQFGDIETAVAKYHMSDPYDLLIEEASLTPVGSEGLLFIPTFNGTTAPLYEPTAKGCLIGLTQSHTRNHVIRALLEGISLEIRWILESFLDTGMKLNEIRLVAGGSKNSYWNQIHANIFNRPVSTIQNPDAALVGAAMCAAVGIGIYQNLMEASQAFVNIKESYFPHKNDSLKYQELFADYKKVFLTLRETGIFQDTERRIANN